MSAADWIAALRTECQRTSQSAAATRIGYSPAVVNQVLKGRYAGDMACVERAVRGALLDARVACPVLGPLRENDCLAHQRRPFAPTNPQRVRLYKACRNGCPHARGGNHE